MVRALDLQFGGTEFKSRYNRLLDLFHGSPEFKSSAMLVNSQLVRDS